MKQSFSTKINGVEFVNYSEENNFSFVEYLQILLEEFYKGYADATLFRLGVECVSIFKTENKLEITFYTKYPGLLIGLRGRCYDTLTQMLNIIFNLKIEISFYELKIK